ncbi:MAG TPA: hypothetical protein VMH04_18845 [Candidatus Solibacter sp.]|nr:hypothetical protein [Candidatus Solibacter sp.]
MKQGILRLVPFLFVVLALLAMAQQEKSTTNSNALALLLQSKGILSAREVAIVNEASTTEEANRRLALLLTQKGLISEQEYEAAVAPAKLEAAPVTPVVRAKPQYPRDPTGAPPATLGPEGISAVIPVRVLPIDVPKQSGLIPDIKLGSGTNMKIYGFFKASAIEDTASSGGPTFGDQDWPLPLLIGGDTGPTADPQFHLKARSFRIGSQFEWVPKNSGFTITAKVEADFEGDYTDVSNRNIGSVRASQFDLRMAYMRLDHKLGALPWFAQFGQDFSLLSSSLPSLFETTGLGVGMGSLYERIPEFRTGVQFHSGDLKIQPEFAIVLPVAGSSGLTTDQRARFGDRAGSDSNEPGVESRVVFQFPLSHTWKRVAPAQFIVSGHHARMNEIIPGQAMSTASSTLPAIGLPSGSSATTIIGATNCPTASCTLLTLFPKGIQDGNPQNVWTTELQLPTPWVTFVTKFYRGDDLRFFFAGQLNDVYSNLNGATSVGAGNSFSGRAISFGCLGGTIPVAGTVDCNGNPVFIAKLQPVGSVGGFVEMSFPLSRIFHAAPEGHNAGWILHAQYGTDRANAADARSGNGLARTDLETISVTYKMNSWVSFVNETSYIVTRAATANSKLFAGTAVTQAHDWRQEFGPIFLF